MGREVIDGEGLILGRMASSVAKRLLNEPETEIVIVNAERVVISGTKKYIFQEYKARRDRGSKEQGPFFPRVPDRIVKRTIRGMLPYKQGKGRAAFSRLKVYLGVPETFEAEERQTMESASAARLSRKYLTLGEVSEKLGWVPRQS
jgi:large subunit ribosomal protein L13